MDGLILIDKPAGLSSSACVGRVRHCLGRVKTGHAGTLDPDATGVLVILVGKATRLSDLFLCADKEYQGTIQLGVVTDTDDAAGEVLSTAEVEVSQADIDAVRKKFLGEQLQVPPQISAVKIDGKRAYRRSRKGETFEIQPRRIQIYELDLDLVNNNTVRYRVKCSKGTYIRSIARDIGILLGCGASVRTLRRIASGQFRIERAVKLEDVGPESLIPWYDPFDAGPSVNIGDDWIDGLAQGKTSFMTDLPRMFDTRSVGGKPVVLQNDGGQPVGLLFKSKTPPIGSVKRILFS